MVLFGEHSAMSLNSFGHRQHMFIVGLISVMHRAFVGRPDTDTRLNQVGHKPDCVESTDIIPETRPMHDWRCQNGGGACVNRCLHCRSLRWRHNGRDSVSNHQPHHCLLKRLFRRRSKKTFKSSASPAFVWGIHRGPVNSPHKWPVTRKMFPFDDVIMSKYYQSNSQPTNQPTNQPNNLTTNKPSNHPTNQRLHRWEPDLVESTWNIPDSKVRGANMGPIWGRQDPGGPHVGPMNFAIWDILQDIPLAKLYFFVHFLSGFYHRSTGGLSAYVAKYFSKMNIFANIST